MNGSILKSSQEFDYASIFMYTKNYFKNVLEVDAFWLPFLNLYQNS